MRALPCSLVCLALAAPAAAETADVDGDGKADTVRIEAPGQVVVERAGGGGAFVPFGLSGTLGKTSLSIGGKGRPYVAAVAQIGNAWEAVVLRWDKGAMKEVWRGPVGPMAGDAGEYEVWVEARASGLVRWQHRRDLDRCDGEAVELFREGWDEASGKFRAARPNVRLPDSMTALRATAASATDRALAGGWYRASGATTTPGAGDAGDLLPPRALDDGDDTTVWREDRGSDGSGEILRFHAAMKGGKAAALRLVHPRGAGNRVIELAVLGKGAAYKLTVPAGSAAGGEAFQATLPAPIEGCVSVVIVGVKRGGGGNVTAIAELSVLSDVELAPGGAEKVLAQQVAKGGLGGESAARALAGRGVAAVMALSEELARAEPASRPRLLAAMAKIEHPAVVTPLAQALAIGELPPGDIVAAAQLLARLGRPGQAALGEILRGSPSVVVTGGVPAESGRLAAARALAASEPRLLFDAAGHGTAESRAELVGLIAGAGAPAILAYLRGEGMAPDSAPLGEAARADLWRAAGKAAGNGAPADRAATAAAMAAALEASAEGDHELRYRLVAALGELGGAAEVGRLMAWLDRAAGGGGAGGGGANGGGAGGGASERRVTTAAIARGRALRRVAAGGLGTNADAAARMALARLAANDDAGTRLAAVRGLATEPPIDTPGARPPITADDTAARDAADAALAGLVARDAWPELRRGAASALGLRCDRKGPRDALETAVARDPELDVRVDALTALVTCRAEGIAVRLLRLADDGKTELALRDRAIALYGQLHAPTAGAAATPAAVDALLDRLERWRGQAFSDETALRLAVRTATALGSLGDRRAAAPLVAAARDGTFPELQAAAAAALGALGPACPRDARTLLRALGQSEQRGVALAARGAVERCGK